MSASRVSDSAAALGRPWIVWLRDDLRLDAHPGFAAAARRGRVLPVFVVESAPRRRAPGGAARWWQKRSLLALEREIAGLGGRLCLRVGAPEGVLPTLAAEVDAAGVCCQRAYDPGGQADEAALKQALPEATAFESLPGDLLAEPEAMLTQAGGPYRVFTPFWRALQERIAARAMPHVRPEAIRWWSAVDCSETVETLAVPDERFGWTRGLEDAWQPGEQGARVALGEFSADTIATYSSDRELPFVRGTSRLSPHLRFGEIAVRDAWDTIVALGEDTRIAPAQIQAWLRQLAWREFCRHLMHHFPDMQTRNARAEFDAFPWREDPVLERAWRTARTGYPLVDAGMRELWRTGWMHNRVRMLAASFLTKHLRIHWSHGEAWFWDTLVDADYANNPVNWQWAAGTGADAAPYFRIFNPSTQAMKFDRDGSYIRRWLPEIAGLSDTALHQPWLAGEPQLRSADIVLGESYPYPVVDHAAARKAALDAYASLRAQAR